MVLMVRRALRDLCVSEGPSRQGEDKGCRSAVPARPQQLHSASWERRPLPVLRQRGGCRLPPVRRQRRADWTYVTVVVDT